MKLQRQLLLVSILLLSLPWAGCQYILGIDATLRFAQEQSLTSTTKAIATVLAQEPQKIYPNIERLIELLNEDNAIAFDKHKTDEKSNPPFNNQHEMFFNTIHYPIIIDGYNDDEWPDTPAIELNTKSKDQPRIHYRTSADSKRLYLFFDIEDNDIIYHNPMVLNRNNGDRLVLVTGDLTHYILTSSAPGIIKAFYVLEETDDPEELEFLGEPSIKAAWQESGNGYTIEVSLPLKLAKDHLGFYIVNEDSLGQVSTYGTLANSPQSLPSWFVYQPFELIKETSIFIQEGTRISVIDKHYWPLSQVGKLSRYSTDSGHWLLRKLYRGILKEKHEGNPNYQSTSNHYGREELHNALKNRPNSRWYNDPNNDTHSILSSAVPIVVNGEVIAAVLAEQSSDRFVALTDDAFNQLLLFSLAALTITGLGLLGYSSWLSWRIRRLSQAAQEVLGDDGVLQNNFPLSTASDEIGDLTRSYASLIHRVHNYTDYLKTLSRKLSHELRTPLAIIHSSLDNLEHCQLDSKAQVYHQRAKDGASRLGNIITAMSEATRVEQSIQQAESEPINLAALLHNVTAAYRDLYRHCTIHLTGVNKNNMNNPSYITEAVPDLIVQMLDKLIDNASDFCPKDGNIIIHYSQEDDTNIIEVSNDGPLLPETMQHQLFDNLVSLRSDSRDQSHLGLGLHIAHLIVQHHNGKITATNRADKSGVNFKIILPHKKPA